MSNPLARKSSVVLCLLAAVLFGTSIHAWLKRRYKPATVGATIPFRRQPHVPSLHIDSVVQHGDIAEIKGTTDPGVMVMINGQQAAVVFDRNQFHHFVGPLPQGTTILSVTCQNEEGGTITQKLAVTVEQAEQ